MDSVHFSTLGKHNHSFSAILYVVGLSGHGCVEQDGFDEFLDSFGQVHIVSVDDVLYQIHEDLVIIHLFDVQKSPVHGPL